MRFTNTRSFVFLILLLFVSVYLKAAENYLITNYGAKPDSVTNNRQFIQKAIDDCFANGGGTVSVPAGVFFTGALQLKSNIELHLSPGAILHASSHKNDYVINNEQVTRLVVAKDADNITISGEGLILGTGQADGAVKRNVSTKMPEFRPGLIQLDSCTNVTLENITLKYSDFFAITLHKCTDILIHGLTIRNNYFHPNSDAIDPGECRNLVISDCNIISGDDCICFKEGGENVVVNNCILSTPSTAIKFGTGTSKIFKDFYISNCIIYNSMTGLGMYMKDGGTIENVSFNNITIEDIQDTSLLNSGIIHQQVPIYIDIDKRTEDSPPGTIKNIRFTNITINSYNAILIQGMKEQPVENLFMNNIFFNVTRPFSFSGRKKPKGFADSKFLYHDDHRLTEFAQKESYLTLANVKSAFIQNIHVFIDDETYNMFPRNSAAFYNVTELDAANITRSTDKNELQKKIVYISN